VSFHAFTDEEGPPVSRSLTRIAVMATGPLLAIASLPASASADSDPASAPAAASPAAAPDSPASTPTVNVTCTAQACTGQRPELTGCDKDGVTIRTGPVTDTSGKRVGTIELRWSATCGVNWSRVTSLIGVNKLQAVVTRSDNVSESSGFNGTSTWSPMIYARGHTAVATGWIGNASGAIADGAPTPGMHFD
jgi:hypothetical protein